MNQVIAVNKLSLAFGKKQILKDISLEIHKGEIFGLLGSFGASIYRQPPQHRIKQGF